MGRPSFKPAKDQRKLVRSLAAQGVRQEHIACLVGLRSPKTLRKHFEQDLRKGNSEAIAAIAVVAYQMAVSGEYPGLTRFWVSTVGGGFAGGPDNPNDPDGRRAEADDAEEP